MSRLTRLYDETVESGVGVKGWVFAVALLCGVAAAAAWMLMFGTLRYLWIVTLAAAVMVGVWLLLAREREAQRRPLLDHLDDVAALRRKNWREFEAIAAQILRSEGWTVYQRGGFSADGGIDLVAENPKGRHFVQCKHWRSWSVGVNRVRELNGVVAGNRGKGGILITCGSFTVAARKEADRFGIELIDGEELVARMRRQQVVRQPDSLGSPRRETTPSAPAVTRELTGRTRLETAPSAPAVTMESPGAVRPGGALGALGADPKTACPQCGRSLVIRTNGKTGAQFWGCPGFPTCQFTAESGPPVGLATPPCPGCSQPMVVRTSRRLQTKFWGCGGFPRCRGARLMNA